MKTVLSLLLLFSVVLSAVANAQQIANPLLRGNENSHDFLVIAHRGARAYAPENTLESFAKAIAIGAHAFELDVHLSKDGIPVVVHDDTLERCSDVLRKFPGRKSYFVSDFTVAELRELDAGSWFVEEINKQQRQSYLQLLTSDEQSRFINAKDIECYRSGKVKLPTLREALLLAKKLGCLVDVEIKNMPRFYPNIAEAVVAVVVETEMTSSTLISCFDHCQLAICKKLDARIAVGILCSERPWAPGDYCESIPADAYHPRYTCLSIGSHSLSYPSNSHDETIDNARAKKIAVYPWTVNDPPDIKILLEAGVSGIISDYPNRVVDAINMAKRKP